MQLISVNIGIKDTVERKNYRKTTGIFKTPTTAAVPVNKLGLEGDFIAEKKYYGREDQAVYIYGEEDYEWWRNERDLKVAPGTFGENLTISSLTSADFNIGDILHVGEVILQVTAPRIPCQTFSARMKDPQFIKKFRTAERPGLLCRVLKKGKVQIGDSVQIEKFKGETISLLTCFRDHYEPDLRVETIQRFLNAPISIRMRDKKEDELTKVQRK